MTIFFSVSYNYSGLFFDEKLYQFIQKKLVNLISRVLKILLVQLRAALGEKELRLWSVASVGLQNVVGLA